MIISNHDRAGSVQSSRNEAKYEAWIKSKNKLDPSSPDFAYDNLEEKRVITGSEAKYVKKVNSKSFDKWTKFGSYEYTSGKTGNRVLATWWRTDYAQKQALRYDHSGQGVFKSTGVNSISRADGRSVGGQASTYGRFIKKIISRPR